MCVCEDIPSLRRGICGPPSQVLPFEPALAFYLQVRKKENGNTKARGEKSIVTQQKCSTWKGEFIALHFHFSLYRLSLSHSFFLSRLIWKWEIKGSRCVCLCMEAYCSLMSCRCPMLEAVSSVSGSLWWWPFTGKWHRESSHIYTDIFAITYGYVNRPDPSPLTTNSGWASTITHSTGTHSQRENGHDNTGLIFNIF